MNRSISSILLGVLLTLTSAAAAEVSDGESWLARSIAYHDPAGTWMQSKVRFVVEGSYADGRVNRRECVVDYQNGDFSITVEMDGVKAQQGFTADRYWCRVDGGKDPAETDREAHNLNPDRATLMRDYMGFLWGLPMKLRDPGTQVDPIANLTSFAEKEVRDIKVSYDAEVGHDIWHIYVDPTDAHLVGYAFYHDVAETDGETITLEGEMIVGDARLPRIRSWYRVADDEFLGTDTLLSGEFLER